MVGEGWDHINCVSWLTDRVVDLGHIRDWGTVTVCHGENLGGQFNRLDVRVSNFAGIGGTSSIPCCWGNCAIEHSLLELRFGECYYFCINKTLGFLAHMFVFGMS